MKKQDLVVLIWESPLIAFLLFSQQVFDFFLYSFGYNVAVIMYYVLLALSALATGLLIILTKISAASKVAGSRYLVGIVYDGTGQADYIEKRIDRYSKIGTSGEYSIYAVFDEHDNIDYVLVMKGEIEEVFSASSKWEVEAGMYYAEAVCYPVSLLKTNLKAFDVKKLDRDIDPTVDVYLVRDAPGFVISVKDPDKPSESLAFKARRSVDILRSAQLFHENLALKEELESVKNANIKINALAIAKASSYIKAHLENQKSPKGGYRLGKWESLLIMVIIITIATVYVLTHFNLWG